MNFIQYIKQAWKAGTSGGTPLSPDRLNHMEDGIKNNNDMISELNNNIIYGNISQKTRYSNVDLEALNISNGTINISKAYINALWGVAITLNVDNTILIQTFIAQNNTIKTRTKNILSNTWSEWKSN